MSRELATRLAVELDRAGQLLNAVGATIAESVSAGQMEDVRGQLPSELRGAFDSDRELADG